MDQHTRQTTNTRNAKDGLTFPVVLQQQWEISRRYVMFATPVAYLIDEQGVIAQDVAIGAEPLQALMANGRNTEADRAAFNRIVADHGGVLRISGSGLRVSDVRLRRQSIRCSLSRRSLRITAGITPRLARD